MFWVKYTREASARLSVEMPPSHHPLPFVLRILLNTPMTSPPVDQQSLKDEIADLERRLHDAKAQLSDEGAASSFSSPAQDAGTLSHAQDVHHTNSTQRSMHYSS